MNNTLSLPCAAGLDLAGVEHRPSGAVLTCGLRIQDSHDLFTDDEIVAFLVASGIKVVGIDAPLCLPPGRASLEERNGCHYRPCDLALRQRGIRFFPITLGPMRALTMRGIRMKQELERRGLRCLETYPGASQDVWGVPRKGRGVESLRQGLIGLGIEGITERMSDHELDAVCCALSVALYLSGRSEVLGGAEEGGIIIPDGPLSRETSA
ncbi:DUF429 domain-containing protein [bacterium]|nr:DUF429 domain-containing protein [bacterium]